MKSKQEWAQIFCNQHVLNVRGKEMEDFVEQIQLDAISSFHREAYDKALGEVKDMGKKK